MVCFQWGTYKSLTHFYSITQVIKVGRILLLLLLLLLFWLGKSWKNIRHSIEHTDEWPYEWLRPSSL